jgi:hypothetical protein
MYVNLKLKQDLETIERGCSGSTDHPCNAYEERRGEERRGEERRKR